MSFQVQQYNPGPVRYVADNPSFILILLFSSFDVTARLFFKILYQWMFLFACDLFIFSFT